jgi:hypothetical protein
MGMCIGHEMIHFYIKLFFSKQFLFLQIFSKLMWFLHEMHTEIHFGSVHYHCHILTNLNMLTHFSKIPNTRFHENLLLVLDLLHADIQRNMMELMWAFSQVSVAAMPKRMTIVVPVLSSISYCHTVIHICNGLEDYVFQPFLDIVRTQYNKYF